MGANQAYDYTAFSNKYSVKQIIQHARTYGVGIFMTIFLMVLVLIMLSWFGVFFFATIGADPAQGKGTPTVALLFMGLMFMFFTGFCVLALWTIVKGVKTSLHLRDFATANGLTFHENTDANNQPGMLFQFGHSRKIQKALELPSGGKAMFGNHRYITGSGKNRQVHINGFVRVSLSRKLPHALLDSIQNNFMGRISNLGGFDGEQMFEQEGDFNNYFKVFTPKDFGRDTLYWLTPELMELLKTRLAAYDIEVVDNYVYLYPGRSVKLDEAGTKDLVALADWLHGEFEENTRRYSDDRVGSFAANVVSQPGRRLKRKFQWWTVLFVVLYIIFRVLIESN